MIKLDLLQNEDYLSVKDQIATVATKEQFEAQFDNLMAISLYEKKIFEVVNSISEIIYAYPHERETGMYVFAVNGKILTANNRRAMTNYLLRNEDENNGVKILVHKLGSCLDFNLSMLLKQEKIFQENIALSAN